MLHSSGSGLVGGDEKGGKENRGQLDWKERKLELAKQSKLDRVLTVFLLLAFSPQL